MEDWIWKKKPVFSSLASKLNMSGFDQQRLILYVFREGLMLQTAAVH